MSSLIAALWDLFSLILAVVIVPFVIVIIIIILLVRGARKRKKEALAWEAERPERERLWALEWEEELRRVEEERRAKRAEEKAKIRLKHQNVPDAQWELVDDGIAIALDGGYFRDMQSIIQNVAANDASALVEKVIATSDYCIQIITEEYEKAVANGTENHVPESITTRGGWTPDAEECIEYIAMASAAFNPSADF